MKRHAAFFKNIAALLMLIALIALLLPFIRITTSSGTASISGMDVLKIGARTGYEYISKGTIENDYVLAEGLSWGDVKNSASYAMEYVELWKVAACVMIASLPLIFCFLSMLCTFIAEGKKTMVFPTVLIILAVLENIILLAGVFRLQKVLADGFAITLLFGIYAFNLLCAAALVILLLLWITGGFNRPKERYENRQSDRNDTDKKKKERTSWRERRNNKKRKKGSKKKKTKKKTKRSKRVRKDNSDRNNYANNETRQQTQNDENTQQSQAQPAASSVIGATGNVTGIGGIYKGVDLNRFCDGNHTFTIGTTPEAMNAIASGSLSEIDKLAGANCVIRYDAALKQYTVTSHSLTDIILQTESREFIRVENGTSQVVGANTLLLAGDVTNCIRLE